MQNLIKFLLLCLCTAQVFALDLTDPELSYLSKYDFNVTQLEVIQDESFVRTNFKGAFHSSESEQFKDVEFCLYIPKIQPDGIKTQLTVILPNLSPLESIDEKIASKLAGLGSHVVLLKTGITFATYAKELKDFNLIIKHQILAAHHILNFSLKHFEKMEQVQVIGVSLGGLLSAIMLSIDDRIGAGITLMAGAGYKGSKHLGIVADVTRALQGRRKIPSPGIVMDPKELKSGYHNKRARLYMTKRDWFVPPERQRDLQNLLENPEIVFLKGMHVKNAVFSPSHVKDYFEFFNKPQNHVTIDE